MFVSYVHDDTSAMTQNRSCHELGETSSAHRSHLDTQTHPTLLINSSLINHILNYIAKNILAITKSSCLINYLSLHTWSPSCKTKGHGRTHSHTTS
uniref:Uncharacterized protein n=1 Tax=Oryza brachyantha TaxID=4533 RepID=J3N662_ORYBR